MVKQLLVFGILVSACIVVGMNPTSAEEAKVTGVVNINTATAEQIAGLPLIGPSKAELIVNYRKTNGNFNKIEDIMNVKGIGEKTFAKIKAYLTTTGETTLATAQ